jgi:hypothetical protein
LPLFSFVRYLVHQEKLGGLKVSIPRKYVIPFFLLLFAGALAIATDYAQVVKEFRKQEYAEVGIEITGEAFNKPSITLFPYMYDYLQFAKTKARINMSSEEIAEVERATKRFGALGALLRMSEIYALNNRPKDAIKTVTTIARLHPEKYAEVYRYWSVAPKEYQGIFQQIPIPASK